MSEHLLKTIEPYWSALESGDKTFEVRLNDRAFQKGDTLRLRKWKIGIGGRGCWAYPTERFDLLFKVTFVLQGGSFGIDPKYCVLGIKRIAATPSNESA